MTPRKAPTSIGSPRAVPVPWSSATLGSKASEGGDGSGGGGVPLAGGAGPESKEGWVWGWDLGGWVGDEEMDPFGVFRYVTFLAFDFGGLSLPSSNRSGFRFFGSYGFTFDFVRGYAFTVVPFCCLPSWVLEENFFGLVVGSFSSAV